MSTDKDSFLKSRREQGRGDALFFGKGKALASASTDAYSKGLIAIING
jgi:hypothetical protein